MYAKGCSATFRFLLFSELVLVGFQVFVCWLFVLAKEVKD